MKRGVFLCVFFFAVVFSAWGGFDNIKPGYIIASKLWSYDLELVQ